ncbi:hypothetical protein [Gordonia sp. ABSL49_1]|uniref:hypothetical protein n=1 Tax=Gordonia sp. ABSL49_1 TaxID=2920941 RepID=UPI001F0E3FC0|nr:hypothetical protein [Gordonia sp. ABSL49_1]MCH5645674.1 hypothetical protein [Gordonia sp. ABSL49_1]
MWATQQDQYIDIDGGVTTFIEPVVIVDGYPVAAHLGIEFTERAVILREVADGPPPPDQEGRPRADWLWKKFCERKGIDYTPLAEVETR